MVVTKRINNNVAVCIDGNQRELIAFGKGIGFPHMPYELTDLSKIDRTFYDVEDQLFSLINDIPTDVIEFTAGLLDRVRNKLPYELNPNIVLTLSDHIAFTIERGKKGVYLRMPSLYEMEQEYPLEIKLSRMLYTQICRHFSVILPKDEIQGIAMHFINARITSDDLENRRNESFMRRYEEILEQTTQIVEWEIGITVHRDTFSYARFASHLQYLLKRLLNGQYIDSENINVYQTICEEYPKISDCVNKIEAYYKETFVMNLTQEEKLYLIMHINRLCAKETV